MMLRSEIEIPEAVVDFEVYDDAEETNLARETIGVGVRDQGVS